MQKIIPILILFLSSFFLSAQENTDEVSIKNVIETFFKGLQNGDSTLMGSKLHKDLKIQTTFTNKEGVKTLATQTKESLLTGTANKKPEMKYLEKLLSYDIKVDGNLASVWTPYEFYVNDNFSHCGANSFQLFNNNGKWQIIYIVDMRRRDDCNALKAKK